MAQFYRDPESVTFHISNWLNGEVRNFSAAGCIAGLSGGVDSATLAALLRKICGRDNMLALIMPCHNAAEDERGARMVADALDIPVKKIDLTETYDQMAGAIETSCGKLGRTARADIKPRLRMAALYATAQVRNFIVAGAANKDELYFGDFTKYGDVGVDVLPFGDLLAGEVTELARYLGVPEPIINRPRAGSSIVEQARGDGTEITYDDIDRFIATGAAETGAVIRIKEAYEISQHKRNPVKIPTIPR